MRRGQATVELVLGSVVMVTVLMLGIHFAEVAQLSLKVQDAATFAVWDASLRRVQSFGANPGVSGFDPVARGQSAQHRFQGFDSTGATVSPVVTRALTRGQGLSVRCEPAPNLHFAPSNTTAPVLLDTGAMRCRASAAVQAFGLPVGFAKLENGGFSQADMKGFSGQVCGIGLGDCQNKYLAVLTNDWGLTTREETATCGLDCLHSPYRSMVERLYGANTGAATAFAATYAGAVPDEPKFLFSYRGEETGGVQLVQSESRPNFVTGGGKYGEPNTMSHGVNCFLGKPGC